MEKLYGLCYGPYRNGQNPIMGPHPTGEQILQDIKHLSKITKRIRTYSTQGGLQNIDLIAKQFQMKVNLGLYMDIINDSKVNELEISNAKKMVARDNLASNLDKNHESIYPTAIECITVGNETVINKGNWRPNANDVDISILIKNIRKIKNELSLPVTTAEPWYVWKNYPYLADEVDFITVHIYPFWDNIPIEVAANYILEKFEEIKKSYPNKDILIGETGHPTEGQSDTPTPLASMDNAKKFLSDFLNNDKLANSKYFMFEAFDEEWKSESSAPNPVGSHWGLVEATGNGKDSCKWFFGQILDTSDDDFNSQWRSV